MYVFCPFFHSIFLYRTLWFDAKARENVGDRLASVLVLFCRCSHRRSLAFPLFKGVISAQQKNLFCSKNRKILRRLKPGSPAAHFIEMAMYCFRVFESTG
uniref:Uncharacterized protein n=1 Tax=Ixodes ricinus TaxID=34613 RepID=A0A147BAI1_IXORI